VFSAEEERSVAHIMIEVSDDVNDEAALTKAQALADQLAAGSEFSALAKAESDDPGSAQSGGDLGVYTQGMLDGPFEQAVYSLTKGEVSQPVRTAFGYHLIKLTDIQSSEPPGFDDIKDQLIAEQLDNKVEQLYVEKLEQLADLTFSAGDLQEPSEELELEILTTEAFGRQGGADELTSNQRVLRTAFDEELIRDGVNSNPVELDSGRTLVLRVKEHIRPRQQGQDEVADQITAQLTADRAGEALQQELDSLLDGLKQGAERAAVKGIEWVSAEKIGRASRDLPFEVLQASFKLPQPAAGASYGSVTMTDGSRAIVAVTAVSAPDLAALTDEERKAMQSVLGQRSGQFDYQAMVEARKANAEIEKL
jgi:peptidyl-prolyl cis-trans isomerase D